MEFGLRLVNIFTICRLNSNYSVVAKIEQDLTLGCYIIGLKPERGFMSPLTMAIYCLAECMVYARWILAPVINGQECGMWTHLKGRICRDLRFYQQFIYSRQLLLAPRHNPEFYMSLTGVTSIDDRRLNITIRFDFYTGKSGGST